MPPDPTPTDAIGAPPAGPRPLIFRLRQMADKADVEGRPIDETVAPEALRAGVPMKMVRCPYHDVRKDHPRMNLSALRQMMRHWSGAIDEVAAMRGAYAAWAGVDPQLDLLQLCRFGHIMETLPGWLVLRPDDPVAPRELPVLAAIVHKVAIGAAFTVNLLYFLHLEGNSPVSRDLPLQAQIHQLANEFSILAVEEEACAGPPAQIDEALAAMIDQPPAPPTRSGCLGDQLPGAARFAANSFGEVLGSLLFTSAKLYAVRQLRDALAAFAERYPDAEVEPWIARADALSDDIHVPTFASRESVHAGDWIAREVLDKSEAERQAIWEDIIALVDGFAGVEHAPRLRALFTSSTDAPSAAAWAAAKAGVAAAVQALPFATDEALTSRIEAVLAGWHQTEDAFVAALQAIEDDVSALLKRGPAIALARSSVLARYPIAPVDLFIGSPPG